MEKKQYPIVYFVLFFLLLALVGFIIRSRKPDQKNIIPNTPATSFNNTFFDKDTINKFASDADFIALLRSNDAGSGGGISVSGRSDVMMKTNSAPQMGAPSETVDRTSTTNVQVVGIDEPDIVKTDNASIYYSKQNQYRYFRNDVLPPGVELQRASSQKMIAPQYQQTNEIVSVNALPPSLMKLQSSIPLNGEMLLIDKVLVIFTNDNTNGALQLIGYSIANPSVPKKLWELPFSNKSQKVTARLYKNSIYLVTSTSPVLPRPCPMPLILGKMNMPIRCTDIYMPSSKPDSNSVYSVLKINPQTGGVEKTISFVGQMGKTTVYMSPEALYISYEVQGNSISILNQFITENQGIFPQYIEEKIKKLQGYDLLQSTKETEMNSLLSQYVYGIDESEKLKLENQLNNAFNRFFIKYKRSFEYTGIVKIQNDSLAIAATGKVPGSALNQFSFDEWKGNLRVATTIGGRNPYYMFGGNNTNEQVSDVYVLDGNLSIKGSAKDLGKTERIYSVRFIEDRGYVVTFRQTDPFYVLDLSNPNTPLVKGELKIPGYSSYLHPIGSHLVLGIGRDNQVKLSLFDVSDPKNPKEVSRYDLVGEYYSEALDNHHAFLQDPKYKIFFLPGSRGGYIFSYEGQALNLVKAIESPIVKRGLYLNDYFYVVTDTGILSYKEGTWDKIGEMVFENPQPEPTAIEVQNNTMNGVDPDSSLKP